MSTPSTSRPVIVRAFGPGCGPDGALGILVESGLPGPHPGPRLPYRVIIDGSGDCRVERVEFVDASPVRVHRPWFKVAINTVLRRLQTTRRPAHLFVLTSIFAGEQCTGYRFGRVLHTDARR